MGHLTPEEETRHRKRLRHMCQALDKRFPEARSGKAWGGWGTNLARCRWELALRSCEIGGCVGIVLPSTILADQASTNMRKTAFRRFRLFDLSSYPPEARLFDRVDQPVVSATLLHEPPVDGVDAQVRLFDAARGVKANFRMKLTEAELKSSGYSLPLGFAAEAASLWARFNEFPCFSDFERSEQHTLWTGREIDETRIAEKTNSWLASSVCEGTNDRPPSN